MTNGLPEGDMGRIGLAVSTRNPALVMAVVEAEDGGIFKSADRGESWERVNELNQRPMYYSQLRIDPNDDRRPCTWSPGHPPLDRRRRHLHGASDGDRVQQPVSTWITTTSGSTPPIRTT